MTNIDRTRVENLSRYFTEMDREMLLDAITRDAEHYLDGVERSGERASVVAVTIAHYQLLGQRISGNPEWDFRA